MTTIRQLPGVPTKYWQQKYRVELVQLSEPEQVVATAEIHGPPEGRRVLIPVNRKSAGEYMSPLAVRVTQVQPNSPGAPIGAVPEYMVATLRFRRGV